MDRVLLEMLNGTSLKKLLTLTEKFDAENQTFYLRAKPGKAAGKHRVAKEMLKTSYDKTPRNFPKVSVKDGT